RHLGQEVVVVGGAVGHRGRSSLVGTDGRGRLAASPRLRAEPYCPGNYLNVEITAPRLPLETMKTDPPGLRSLAMYPSTPVIERCRSRSQPESLAPAEPAALLESVPAASV